MVKESKGDPGNVSALQVERNGVQNVDQSLKERFGRNGFIAFLICGGIQFALAKDATLFGWKALAFFIGGAFLSSLVLGAGAYYLIYLPMIHICVRPDGTVSRKLMLPVVFVAKVALPLMLIVLAWFASGAVLRNIY